MREDGDNNNDDDVILLEELSLKELRLRVGSLRILLGHHSLRFIVTSFLSLSLCETVNSIPVPFVAVCMILHAVVTS